MTHSRLAKKRAPCWESEHGLCPWDTRNGFKRSRKPAAVTGRPQVLELGCWREIQSKQVLGLDRDAALHQDQLSEGRELNPQAGRGILFHLAGIRCVFPVEIFLPAAEGTCAGANCLEEGPSPGGPALGMRRPSGMHSTPPRPHLTRPGFASTASSSFPLDPKKIYIHSLSLHDLLLSPLCHSFDSLSGDFLSCPPGDGISPEAAWAVMIDLEAGRRP